MPRALAALLAVAVLSVSASAQVEKTLNDALQNVGADKGAYGMQVAGISNWFKTPADKATDADKLEFLKGEGEPVDQGYFTESNGSIRLTDKGNAVFNRMKTVYNDQSSLARSGYQKVSDNEGAFLMAVQRSVNVKILQMKDSCLQYERTMAQIGNGSGFSFSCNFIDEISYARQSGKSVFASADGRSLLATLPRF